MSLGFRVGSGFKSVESGVYDLGFKQLRVQGSRVSLSYDGLPWSASPSLLRNKKDMKPYRLISLGAEYPSPKKG